MTMVGRFAYEDCEWAAPNTWNEIHSCTYLVGQSLFLFVRSYLRHKEIPLASNERIAFNKSQIQQE